MSVRPVDMSRGRHDRASSRVIRMPLRDRAVQRWKTRVRWWWRRAARATAAQRDRHDPRRAWRYLCLHGARTRSGGHTSLHGTMRSHLCRDVTWSRGDRRRGRVHTRTNTAIAIPTCTTARCDGESCEALVAADGALRRSPLRDAGASIRSGDVWLSASLAADPVDARSGRCFNTRDEIPLPGNRRRSALRDPRRRLARIRIQPVRPGRVPSGACPGHGGAPA